MNKKTDVSSEFYTHCPCFDIVAQRDRFQGQSELLFPPPFIPQCSAPSELCGFVCGDLTSAALCWMSHPLKSLFF